MATLILSTVGRSVGGPIGAVVGATLGGIVDRALFGGTGRAPARLANLAVQSAAYGEPIAHILGRMRIAGNLIWATTIKETPGGGGKNAPAASGYSYSASFAVALSGRRIDAIERIWADGKLLRGADGVWITPVTMRLHAGDETQAVDPLIAAAEGEGATPAYRGIAYVVFEDLPLADYGNRIPNLTFEIVGQGGAAIPLGAAATLLADRPDLPALAASGAFPQVAGLAAAAAGSLAEALRPVVAAAGAALAGGLSLRGDEAAALTIAADDVGAVPFGRPDAASRRQRAAAASLPAGLAIGHFDPDRDYQAGLQRVLRGPPGTGVDNLDLPMAMAAVAAKGIGAARLAQRVAGRETLTVTLPWRHAGIGPGETIGHAGAIWRVRERRMEAMVVGLDLQRLPAQPATASAAAGGRALPPVDFPVGPTTVLALDLPPLDADAAGVAPRLWLAAAGVSPGWRSAAIEISFDAGASYAVAGVAAASNLGSALTTLAAGPANLWDRHATVDVELLADSMWLESRPDAAVLAGANLALLGDELIQFGRAEPIAPRRFRLSSLLRGRRGSDLAIATHIAGERFVLVDPVAMIAVDPPIAALGLTLRVRAAGRGDAATEPADVAIAGNALRPLSPAGLALALDGGDVVAHWTRRSRLGFGWPDFTDVPLAEDAEQYRIELLLDGRLARQLDTAVPVLRYTAADRAADGDGATVTVRVAQLSASVGPGSVAAATISV